MPHRYSTALSHIILAGTSIYCCSAYNGGGIESAFAGGRVGFPTVTYVVIAINSIIGVWRWGNPDHGDDVDGLYRFTSFLEIMFALPCIATQIWLDYGYTPMYVYIHAGFSLFALVTYIDEDNTDLIDMIVLFNSASLGIVSVLHENYNGLAAAVSFYLIYIYFKKRRRDHDLPAQDLYNYGLCFFSLFALGALGVSTTV